MHLEDLLVGGVIQNVCTVTMVLTLLQVKRSCAKVSGGSIRAKFLISCHKGEWTGTLNPPTASHMGGIWERLIRSTRRMKALLQERVISDEVLVTVKAGVESILNSTLLCKLSLDASDNDPLTPNHLIPLRLNLNMSPGVFQKTDIYGRRH
ncbi:hypothetical protein HOLleu_38371 [Holothuria leucospilota]|uniref:Uncharacterized protein n=1 Tax=Holothuria leucospilota TaxID=206669 RepID=A0A9Q0YEA0_HOLLE|nr:hypothetical protein HOLleu_38371 [Holothuria leucospilota]